MAQHDCDICSGAGKIRLPVYGRVPAVYSDSGEITAKPAETSRTFACPQCGPKVEHERIALVYARATCAAEFVNEPGYDEHVKRDAAHRLADELLKGGFITYARSSVDELRRTFKITSKLGVVSPSAVATMETRIAERQGDVAAKVVDEAVRLIDTWGSYYGRETVTKSEAARFVREALRNVTSNRET